MRLNEKHKAGCGCGFCKNKGSFGKKKTDDKAKDDTKEKEATTESRINWSQRLAALRKRRGEPVAESIVRKMLD